MPFGERGFRPKQPTELRDQLKEASEQINGKKEFSLTPPSVKQKDILRMPVQELKEKFARRYEMYLAILRNQKVAGGGVN